MLEEMRGWGDTAPCTDKVKLAAGVTDRLWSIEDIAAMIDAAAPKPGRLVSYRKSRPEISN
jgi:hypothetical protein